MLEIMKWAVSICAAEVKRILNEPKDASQLEDGRAYGLSSRGGSADGNKRSLEVLCICVKLMSWISWCGFAGTSISMA